ncbi:MAG: hypothetical protein N3A38_03905, partial [Planctomycetota bacterium]|nr:hypothetical protein [Planctomycetota bacterium]
GETGWRPAAKAAGDGRPGVPAGPTDADSSLRVKAIAAGRRLARLYGCFACHAISGMYDEPKPGPDHGTAGDKYIREIQFGDTDIPRTRWDYFSKKIADPRAFETDSPRGASRLRMPKFRLSDRDIHALTTMLLSFTTERVPESRRRRPSPADSPALLGERAIRRLNCAGCHVIGLEEAIVPLAEMSDRKGRRELERRGGWIAPDIFRSPDGLLFAGAGTALSSQVMAVLSGEVLRTGLPLRQAWDACAPGRLDAAGPAQRRRLLADLRIAIRAAGLEAILDAGANVRAKDLAVATGADRNVAGPANAAWSLCGARPASDVRPAIGVRVRIVTGEAAIRASGAFDRLQDAPPSLAFEGGKARPGWLYGFLRDPGQQNLRPGLKVRMPSFFLPSSSVPGATGDLKPGTGTEVPARGRSGGPSGGKAPAVYRAGRLAADPSRLPGGGDEVAHIVEYFLKAAGAGRFEPPRPPRIDPEKYRRGAYLLGRGPGRFGCTDCHPAGGSRPGGPRSDWGSDLADVRLRLREDWLRRFLRQPAAFYPWTNMPSSFYSFANYRETEEDATRAIFRRADNPEEPLRGKAASEEAARINEAVDALIHYLLHAGEAEIRLPE